MSKPRVFISYTGRSEADRERAKNLAEALRAARMEPLIDTERLEEGRPWRPELHRLLAECHGGVVLVSPEALGSKWVAQEAAILEHRRQRSPWFSMLPALVAGVEASQLAESELQAVGLADVQAFAGADEDVLPAIVARLDEKLAVWRSSSHDDAVRDLVFAKLQRLELEPLRLCAQQLGLGLDAILGDGDLPSVLARAIAEEMVAAMEAGRFQPIVPALQALKDFFELKDACYVLDRLGPFWVDAGAAQTLRRAVIEPPGMPVVGVNAVSEFAGKMYVDRASSPLWNWKVETALNVRGEDEAEDEAAAPAGGDAGAARSPLVDEVERLLCVRLHETPAKLKAKIAFVVSELKNPILVLIRGDVDDEELEELESAFRQVHFLVLTGDRTPASPDWSWQRVRFLEPALDTGAETAWSYRLEGSREAVEDHYRPRNGG